jgi:hypothetical protein
MLLKDRASLCEEDRSRRLFIFEAHEDAQATYAEWEGHH